MKNIAIIQARLSSTRFPGKILSPVLGHMTALEAMVERVKLSKLVDDVIIATTNNPKDTEIIDVCNTNGWRYYVGDENDVLKRVCDLIIDFKLLDDNIIDLTSDCVCIPFEMLDNMLEIYNEKGYHYYSNTIVRGFYDGADIQIYKGKLLLALDDIVTNKQHRTHVGWNILCYLGKLQNEFSTILKVGNYNTDDDKFMPDTRIVLDHKEDLILIRKIFDNFKRINFTYEDIIKFIRDNPNVLNDKTSKTPGVD